MPVIRPCLFNSAIIYSVDALQDHDLYSSDKVAAGPSGPWLRSSGSDALHSGRLAAEQKNYLKIPGCVTGAMRLGGAK